MEKYYVSWDEFFDRLYHIFSPFGPGSIYGVPKGGMVMAGYLNDRQNNLALTHQPEYADMIIDDIIDSGETRDYYQEKYPDAKFIGLYDKTDVLSKNEEWGDKWIVFPWEADHPAGEESVQDNITRVLEYIGEDPEREGLQDTPNRVVRSWDELYAGYDKNPEDLLTTFGSNGYDEIVLLKDIEMYSMCEHHMLPFYGKGHVAYIPDEKVIGISKLARILDMYGRRLQIQERIGEQVVNTLMEHLQPKGAACIIEARHMCMCSRGVGKQNSIMTTSSLKGAFMEKPEARQELMNLIS